MSAGLALWSWGFSRTRNSRRRSLGKVMSSAVGGRVRGVGGMFGATGRDGGPKRQRQPGCALRPPSPTTGLPPAHTALGPSPFGVGLELQRPSWRKVRASLGRPHLTMDAGKSISLANSGQL